MDYARPSKKKTPQHSGVPLDKDLPKLDRLTHAAMTKVDTSTKGGWKESSDSMLIVNQDPKDFSHLSMNAGSGSYKKLKQHMKVPGELEKSMGNEAKTVSGVLSDVGASAMLADFKPGENTNAHFTLEGRLMEHLNNLIFVGLDEGTSLSKLSKIPVVKNYNNLNFRGVHKDEVDPEDAFANVFESLRSRALEDLKQHLDYDTNENRKAIVDVFKDAETGSETLIDSSPLNKVKPLTRYGGDFAGWRIKRQQE